jgi:outer membrane protein, heavy metal efflux system
MLKSFLLISTLLSFALSSKSQNNIDNILASIAQNNKSIKASQQFWEAKKTEFKINLFPENPKVEYDYLIGYPSSSGNQTDFNITQSLDFPTVYFNKKSVSNKLIKQSENFLVIEKREILLDAKLTCVELIYRNKRQIELTKRIQATEKLHSHFQKRLESGEGNILDLNKTKIQLINLQNEERINKTEISLLNQKLTQLNGGNNISLSDTVYPALPEVLDFEKLESEIETTDPTLLSLQQAKQISEGKVKIAKSLSLPKVETGYHSQAILGQRFEGIHLGVTIPLWQYNKTVKAEKANMLLSKLKVEEHRNEHYYEIKHLYEKQQSFRITLKDYKEVLTSIKSSELLSKALLLGEISSIQYLMEVSYFYNSQDNYLILEKELNETIAQLYKFQL